MKRPLSSICQTKRSGWRRSAQAFAWRRRLRLGAAWRAGGDGSPACSRLDGRRFGGAAAAAGDKNVASSAVDAIGADAFDRNPAGGMLAFGAARGQRGGAERRRAQRGEALCAADWLCADGVAYSS